jgi:hypothetical protein
MTQGSSRSAMALKHGICCRILVVFKVQQVQLVLLGLLDPLVHRVYKDPLV